MRLRAPSLSTIRCCSLTCFLGQDLSSPYSREGVGGGFRCDNYSCARQTYGNLVSFVELHFFMQSVAAAFPRKNRAADQRARWRVPPAIQWSSSATDKTSSRA